MADEPRVAVTTRPTKTGKPRKGTKNTRVPGAQRTDSGLHLVRASQPGGYALASPATAKAFKDAVDLIEYGVDDTGREIDTETRDKATVQTNALAAEARADASLNDSQLDILTDTVSSAIDRSRELPPEDAGALLAATQVHMQETQLSQEERRDPRVAALSQALVATFSNVEPTGDSPFTPSRPGGNRPRRTSSASSAVSRLSFEDEEEQQPSLAGRAFGALTGAVGNIAGATAGAASRAMFGDPDEEEESDEDSPARTESVQDQSTPPGTYQSPVGVPASSVHGGSPHLSSVISGSNQPSPRAVEILQNQRELQTVRQLLQMRPEDAANLPRGGAQQSPLAFVPRQVARRQSQEARQQQQPQAVQPQAQAQAQAVQQQQPGPQQNIAQPQMAAVPAAVPGAPPAPPVGVAIAPPIRAAIERQTRDTAVALAGVRDAVNRIGSQQELTPAQVSTVLLNLEGGPDPMNPGQNIPPAPLTAQLLAQGKINMRQLIVPAEVQSYEKALRERRVAKDSDGREQRVYSTRLRAQPVLTRYVEDPVVRGAKRYRQPRVAGPRY